MRSLQHFAFWSSLHRIVWGPWHRLSQPAFLRRCSCLASLGSTGTEQWRELSLAFAVAAQCGVVERVLNKWWSCSSITCTSAQKMHFISLHVSQVLVLVQRLILVSKCGSLQSCVTSRCCVFLLLPSLLLLISLQRPPLPVLIVYLWGPDSCLLIN